MQTYLQETYRIARELNRKHQVRISDADVGEEVKEMLRGVARDSVISILVFAGITASEAVRIAGSEIIGSTH